MLADLETMTAIIAGLGAVLTALVKLVPSVRELWEKIAQRMRTTERKVVAHRQHKATLQAMRRVSAMRSQMELLLPEIGAQRLLLLAASNGGEAWTGAGPLYVSNPAQVVSEGEPNTADGWQQWKVDSWYRDFLAGLLEAHDQQAPVKLVREANVQGELQRQYRAQGTVASVVLPVCWEDGGVLWFLSANFGCRPKKSGADRAEPMSDQEMRGFAQKAGALHNDKQNCRAVIRRLQGAYNSAG